MTQKEYYQFINDRNRCVPAYQQFQQGKKTATAGWSVFGVGAGLFVVGCGMALGEYIYHGYVDFHFDGDDMGFLGLVVFAPLSGVMMAVGAGVAGAGHNKMNNAYKAYNEYCAEQKPQLTLGITASSNGIGLALRF